VNVAGLVRDDELCGVVEPPSTITISAGASVCFEQALEQKTNGVLFVADRDNTVIFIVDQFSSPIWRLGFARAPSYYRKLDQVAVHKVYKLPGSVGAKMFIAPAG